MKLSRICSGASAVPRPRCSSPRSAWRASWAAICPKCSARLSQTLREKQVIEGKIAALTAQGRLQARIVGLLPLALLVVMTRMEPQAMRLMYTTPQGWAALLVLAVLEISGTLLLRRLVRIEV